MLEHSGGVCLVARKAPSAYTVQVTLGKRVGTAFARLNHSDICRRPFWPPAFPRTKFSWGNAGGSLI